MTRIAKLAGTSGLALVVSLLLPASSPTHAQTRPRRRRPSPRTSCPSCSAPVRSAIARTPRRRCRCLTYQDVRPWVRSIKARVSTRQMPPWHIDRSIGEYLDDPSLSDQEIATIVKWIDSGAPQGNPADAPPPLKFMPVDEWAFGEPDLVVEMKKGFAFRRRAPTSLRTRWSIPASRKTATSSGSRSFRPPTAACTTRTCTPRRRKAPTGKASGSGWVRTPTNEVDLIEYAAGNDADIFAEGTAKLIKAGSLFRFSPHYHPYGKEIYDRQKVGIKFYPKGYKPKYVVTSHRIRTGVGNDWALNREKVEDVILRAGHKIDIDEPTMPTGALVEENPLHSVAMLSIPPNTVARHERFWPLPKPALIISFQPHMHFRGTRMLLEAIHPDGRREDADRRDPLRTELADHLHLQDAASVPGRHDSPHDVVARQHRQQQAQPRSDGLGRLGQPDDGRNGPRLDRHRVPDRRSSTRRGAREEEGARSRRRANSSSAERGPVRRTTQS